MAVIKPCIMRGLYIPDANFTSPSNDAWTTGGDIISTDLTFHAAQGSDYVPGTGRFARVRVDGCAYQTGDAILSAFTPHGVAADTYASLQYFWVGVIARSVGIGSGNTNTLIFARIRDYDENGVNGSNSAWVALSAELGAGSQWKYGADWALFGSKIVYNTASDSKHYRLELAFNTDSAGGTDNFVDLSWAGIGLPIDSSTGYDQLSSLYDATPSKSQSTLSKIISNRNSRNPHSFVQNPENLQSLQVNMPYLSLADKQLIEQCEQWHNGAPLDDVTGSGTSLSNRGNKQPVLWVMDRPEFKRAFYAHMGPFQPMINNAGWYPETGAIHAGALMFQEWA